MFVYFSVFFFFPIGSSWNTWFCWFSRKSRNEGKILMYLSPFDNMNPKGKNNISFIEQYDNYSQIFIYLFTWKANREVERENESPNLWFTPQVLHQLGLGQLRTGVWVFDMCLMDPITWIICCLQLCTFAGSYYWDWCWDLCPDILIWDWASLVVS